VSSRHYSPRSISIVVTDMTWLVVSLAVAVGIDLSLQHPDVYPDELAVQVGFAAVLYLGAFYYADLYNFSELRLRREIVAAGVRAFSTLALLFGLLFVFTPWLEIRSFTVLLHLILTTAFIIVVRTRIDGILTRYGVFTRTAIVGTGSEARALAVEILKRPENGHELTWFVSPEAQTGAIELRTPNPGLCTVPVIPAVTLLQQAREAHIKRILVATADLGADLPVHELLRCKAEGFPVEDGHTFYERLLGRILTDRLRPEWLIFSDGFARSGGARAAKRAVDLIAATGLLVVTLPLCLLVALAIKLQDRGPVLFGQVRVGLQGKLFTLWKFRSMRVDAEARTGATWAGANDPRITPVGRWIRHLRIDEIPQGWNVLCGDMSFVGPRPERPEFVATLRQKIPYYDYRSTVRPGISGWAQVNLPYTATVDDSREKLEYDLYYLKNFSVLMDLFILFRTIKIIVFGWGSR
jgi:sugar transferase (PEP-CTERM system associated)